MRLPTVYHSAFREDGAELGELEYFSDGKSVVKFHDINEPTPPEFADCDCIYVEPAWRRGFETFKRRAGAAGNFNEYLDSIQRIVTEVRKPAFVVGGRHMQRRLRPEIVRKVQLNGFSALLMTWNAQAPRIDSALDLQRELACCYPRVLDFCCGYGAHLPLFRSFVASDVNKRCVYYVATNYMGYES